MQPAITSAAKPKRGRGHPPFISTAAELPLPPSANALWFNAPGRGRVRTDSYNAWLAEAGWMLKQQRIVKIPGTVGLTLLAGLPKRARDLDNIFKACGDLLQAHGIIENDNRVCEIFARWDRAVPTGFIRLEVRQVRAPALRLSPDIRERFSVRQAERRALAAKLRSEAEELRRRGEAGGLVP
jgi:Holliday junction resolvase RusA-like endonuclease